MEKEEDDDDDEGGEVRGGGEELGQETVVRHDDKDSELIHSSV